MALSDKPLSLCMEADLLALREPEGKTIEYKRDLVGKTDADRKEFLYDVSSFANTSGGHLIFGMDEKDGMPSNLIGFQGVNVDAEILRLQEMIRDGIRPPIYGIDIVAVRLASGNFALVIHVPKSWNAPHQVTYQKTFRFYARHSNGKYQLDVDELRSTFLLSASAAERMKAFRVDRIAKIVGGDTAVPLPMGAKAVTHILPLSSFTVAQSVDLNRAWRDHSNVIGVLGSSGSSPSFNLDGLLVSSSHSRGRRYVQLFRDGCVEVVDAFSDEANKRAQFPATAFENQIIYKVFERKGLVSAAWNYTSDRHYANATWNEGMDHRNAMVRGLGNIRSRTNLPSRAHPFFARRHLSEQS
jgi:hypothetical protein